MHTTTNKIVFFSAALCKIYPRIFAEITATLHSFNIKWETIGGTRNLWIRDWMPIKTPNGLVKFKYKKGKYSCLEVSGKCWSNFNTTISNIILDGGNVEQGRSCVLMTEIVFKHNKDIDRNKFIQHLEKIFDKKVVFLPVEPGDTIGHIDGIARFVNENTVLINDYSILKKKRWNEYQKQIANILHKAGMEVVTIPYAYDQCPYLSDEEFYRQYPYGDENNPAVGYYINFLVVKPLILLPIFGFEKDEQTINTMAEYFPDHVIGPIECKDLAMLGGLIRCVTWEN
jgi:agmatine/peptidylarginine deiminase